jgi:hypothetical protein
MNIDVRKDAGLPRYHKVRDPSSDHVSGGVLKAEMFRALATSLPIKVCQIERSGFPDVRGWNLQICESTMVKEVDARSRTRFFLAISHAAILSSAPRRFDSL